MITGRCVKGRSPSSTPNGLKIRGNEAAGETVVSPMAELPLSNSSPAPPAKPPRTFPLRLAILLLTVSLFGCDHATKIAADASLPHSGPGPSLVKGVLELRYTENFDTAFSLLQSLGIPRTPVVLLAASTIALLGVIAMWIGSRKRASRAQHIGFALVLAGALGNVVDRAWRGYVIDFIDWHWVNRPDIYWPTFNVADSAIVVGVLLWMLVPSDEASNAPKRTVEARE